MTPHRPAGVSYLSSRISSIATRKISKAIAIRASWTNQASTPTRLSRINKQNVANSWGPFLHPLYPEWPADLADAPRCHRADDACDLGRRGSTCRRSRHDRARVRHLVPPPVEPRRHRQLAASALTFTCDRAPGQSADCWTTARLRMVRGAQDGAGSSARRVRGDSWADRKFAGAL